MDEQPTIPIPEKPQRKGRSDFATSAANKAAACKISVKKRRADKLQTLAIINLVGDLWYYHQIRDYDKISKLICDKLKHKRRLKARQIGIYIKKFADSVQDNYRGEFKNIIDKVVGDILLSSDKIGQHRLNQLSILLSAQAKGEADPKTTSEIRLILDAMREDKRVLIDNLAKLGIVDAPSLNLNTSNVLITIPDNGRGDANSN